MTDLNEMWQELERYQPFADKRGFGETWKRMTTERTKKAAWAAWAAAASSARAAAEWAANAASPEWGFPAEWAQRAIGKIRDAIEQEQT